MSDIYLDTLVYYQIESDEIATIERTRVDAELAKKTVKSDEGSPGGIATLDSNGDISNEQIPYANHQEIIDGIATNKIVNAEGLQYKVDAHSVPLSAVAQADGVAPLDINSKIPSIYIPDTSTVNSFYVQTIADMLVLINVVQGDRCLVHDDPTPENNGEYIAIIDNPVLEGDWGEVPVHNAVSSVNGLVGIVNLDSTQLPEISDNRTDIDAHKVITDQNTAKGTANEDRIIVNEADILTNAGNIVIVSQENITQDGRLDTIETLNTNQGTAINDNTLAITDLQDGSVEFAVVSFPTDTAPALTEGQIGYDGVHKQFIMKDDVSASTLNIGHEMWLKCYNPGATTILNGTPVRQIGVSSGYASVEPAIADIFSNAIIVGIATHDIPAGTYGNLATIGQVGDVPVNQGGETWNVGEALYLSSTVAGELTNVLPPVGTVVGTLLATNGVTGSLYAKTSSLISLPPVGGWMKAIPETIDPGAGYNQFSGFTDVSTSAGIIGDGVTGIFDIDNAGTYEISLSVSFSGITGQNNGSIITIQLYNVNGAESIFEYNIIVGRDDTVASGTLITQGDFTTNGQLVARYKETSGNVGAAVVIDNISFIIKSILIR